jgi:hypothetical protein
MLITPLKDAVWELDVLDNNSRHSVRDLNLPKPYFRYFIVKSENTKSLNEPSIFNLAPLLSSFGPLSFVEGVSLGQKYTSKRR